MGSLKFWFKQKIIICNDGFTSPSLLCVFQNIRVVVPEGETVESCGHNTRGKDSVSYSELLEKSIELIS